MTEDPHDPKTPSDEDRPRSVGGYGEPEDLADKIEAAYGPEPARAFLDHVAARRSVEESPFAALASTVMAQRQELDALAAGLRADSAGLAQLRDDLAADLGAETNPERRAGLQRVSDWLAALDDD